MQVTQLDQDLDSIAPKDAEALTAHAIARIRAGEWFPDVADVIANQIVTWHGQDALLAFEARVADEIERRRA